MSKKISNFFKGEIVSSAFYILFGLCLIIFTEQTINLICKVIFGVVMIGAGIYHICIYAAEKENSTILDLFTGVIVLVLGGFLFFTPQIIIKILPYLLGAFVLVDNIWTLKGVWKLKKLGNAQWKILLIGSVVFIALGIFVIVYPFTKIIYTAIFAGSVMLADGLSDIVFLVLLKRGIKRGVVVVEKVPKTVKAVPTEAEKEAETDRSRSEAEKTTEEKTEPEEAAETEEKEEEKEVLVEAEEAAEEETEMLSAEEPEVDEGEDEESLEDEIIINGRWKNVDEEVVSPAGEIDEMKEPEKLEEWKD